MNKDVWKNKAIAREKLTRLFYEKVSDMPEPTFDIPGYDYEFQKWCIEIREIELALREAGVTV